MWKIFEGPKARKALAKLPEDILKRYEKWKDVVMISGPRGLRLIKGFHDEALRGKWFGYRCSRINERYRVIYTILRDRCWVDVIDLNAHDYRRRR